MVTKEKKKNIIIFVVIFIAFILISIPFKNQLKVNYVTEVRPASVLNTICSLFFGIPAILATTLANSLLDCLSGVPTDQVLAYIIPEFSFGFIHWYMWRKLNKKEPIPFCIDGMPKIVRFLACTLLGCASFSAITGMILGAFNRSVSLFIDFTLFTFVNNVVMNLFLGIPLLIALNRFFNKNKLTICEKYLLISGIFESIGVILIIAITCRMNPDANVTDSHFWNRIYFMSIAVILFIIGITIVIIAMQLDKNLKEQNYELGIAANIQKSVLPTKFDLGNEHVNIFASIKPAKEIGGDFYDFYYIDQNHLAFLIADVSGKGIPAALFMMRAVSTIRNYATLGLTVNEIIQNANTSLCENNKQHYFVTAWMGILDLETGNVCYCNAGHNPPAVKSVNGKAELLEMENSVVLGFSPRAQYKKFDLTLSNGDIIYLYTDGVNEARNVHNEMFTNDRLLKQLDETGNDPELACKSMQKTIDEFSEKANQFDDITMLALKYEKS